MSARHYHYHHHSHYLPDIGNMEPRKANILQQHSIICLLWSRNQEWDVNEYGEARLRWQYNAESGRWWNVQQVWSFDPIFVFDPGMMVRSKVTLALMEWWEAVWGLGELEQNMLIFNPHISSANLFLENSHAVLNYFSASYVICSKNNQDFFAFLFPTDEKMLTSWKHCINAFLVQMKTSIMTREMLKKCQVTDPKWIQKW